MNPTQSIRGDRNQDDKDADYRECPRGEADRAFWECYDGDLDLPTLQVALREWVLTYNTIRAVVRGVGPRWDSHNGRTTLARQRG